jgi:hypothetical protein
MLRRARGRGGELMVVLKDYEVADKRRKSWYHHRQSYGRGGIMALQTASHVQREIVTDTTLCRYKIQPNFHGITARHLYK